MNAITVKSCLLCGLLAGACASPEVRPTARDDQGNYATTSNFRAPQRSEFATSMRAGLADFDKRCTELETRASTLGQAAINELHAQMPGLTQKRTAMVNAMARLDAALDKDWPARREETQTAYDDLRKALDEAFADVLK